MGNGLSLITVLMVFLGGGMGSVFRYISSTLGLKLFSNYSFPFATLFVNIIGCLLIGYFTANLMKESSTTLKLFFITGFCGGFTTFSAFSIENYQLWQEGSYSQLILYITLSVLIGIGAVILGLNIGTRTI